jgi:hypothetical protein
MDGIQDKRGWRWIFIIEGCITVFVGLISPFFIPDFPGTIFCKKDLTCIDQTTFLNAEEKKLVATRLAVDNMGDVGRMDVLDRKSMKRAFSDYKIYVGYVRPIIPGIPTEPCSRFLTVDLSCGLRWLLAPVPLRSSYPPS